MSTIQTTLLRRCDTRYFGPVEYREESVMVFPEGIPAFEHLRGFLPLRQPVNEPLVFLQSLSNPDLCFVTLPVLSACPDYRLRLMPEDLAALELEAGRQPAIGTEVLCLAILSLEEHAPPTANLLAPIVVNMHTRRGRQAIQTGSPYSHREVLPMREAACS